MDSLAEKEGRREQTEKRERQRGGRGVASVGDVLRLEGLAKARVLAGRDGLDRSVSWITVGEEPDLPEWIFGGELVLSTLFAITPERRAQYVEGLAQRGGAGLFVKTQRFIGELSPEVIERADGISFPLVEVPSHVLWSRVLAAFYNAAIQRQAEQVRVETEMRLRGGFVEELLSGGLRHDEILQRAGFLGCDLSGGGAAVVFDIRDFAGFISRQGLEETQVQRLKRVFYEAVDGSVRETRGNCICTPRSDSVLVILGGDGADTETLASRVLLRCQERLPGVRIHAGIGEEYPEPAQILTSCREADSALQVGQQMKDTGQRIHAFGELGTDRLLFSVRCNDPSLLSDFERQTVAPLLEYDARHGTHLMETLQAYMECDGNLSEAAGQLFAHRHTVRYRLKRVGDITGLDVSRFEDATRLYLAVRASRIT